MSEQIPYFSTEPNLNDALTAQQQESFKAYIRGEDIEVVESSSVEFVVGDVPGSYLSIKEAIEDRLHRERNLGR